MSLRPNVFPAQESGGSAAVEDLAVAFDDARLPLGRERT